MSNEQIRQEAEKLLTMTGIGGIPASEYNIAKVQMYLASFAARARNEGIEFVAKHYDSIGQGHALIAMEHYISPNEYAQNVEEEQAHKSFTQAAEIRSLKSQKG